jgi:hypothetical protein
MSAGSRQEVMIRSKAEALVRCLWKQTISAAESDKPKKLAVERLYLDLESYWKKFPIQLSRKEANLCRIELTNFHQEQLSQPDGCNPESVIAMLMTLVNHLAHSVAKNKNGKVTLLDRINKALMGLYDCFDIQGNKYDLMATGAQMAERFIGRAI